MTLKKKIFKLKNIKIYLLANAKNYKTKHQKAV